MSTYVRDASSAQDTHPRGVASHIRELEAESVYILREVAAEFENPVMLYSAGKDSSVMLRLAQKAFRPGKMPFPLLHVDTTFKFPEMIEFRDRTARGAGVELIAYTHHDALRRVGGAEHWTCAMCANLLKTQALVAALREHGFDAAIGGARRDEERSRAKERIFSFRGATMQWDPRNQRPELWRLFNTCRYKGESFRVFPLSNWTELDVWRYVRMEDIPVVSLYFARPRQVVRRDGMLLLAGPVVTPRPGERVQTETCRCRTLGCQLCTGLIRSQADTVPKIIDELELARTSEREFRAVDLDRDGSMEIKKVEGYF